MIQSSLRSAVLVARLVCILGTMIAHANDDRYDHQWTSRAEVRYNGNSLVASYLGVDLAGSHAEAVEIARSKSLKKINEDYPGGVVNPNDMVIRTLPVIDDEPGGVKVRVWLICRTLLIVDEGLQIGVPGAAIPLISNEKEKDQFSVVLTRKMEDDVDQPFRGNIQTAGRGPLRTNGLEFEVWKGRPIRGDAPVVINLSLQSKERDNGQLCSVGEFSISVRQSNDKLGVTFTPGAKSRLIGEPITAELNKATFRLTGKDESGCEVQFDALVSVSNPHAADQREERIRAFEEKLDDRPATIGVLSGSVSAKYRNAQGQLLELGVQRTFVVSKDTAAARTFVKDLFDGRRDVEIVPDEAAAREALDKHWKRSRSTTFKNKDVVESSVKIDLRPKPGYTISEDLTTYPGRTR